jgi:hypothetical protein
VCIQGCVSGLKLTGSNVAGGARAALGGRDLNSVTGATRHGWFRTIAGIAVASISLRRSVDRTICSWCIARVTSKTIEPLWQRMSCRNRSKDDECHREGGVKCDLHLVLSNV